MSAQEFNGTGRAHLRRDDAHEIRFEREFVYQRQPATVYLRSNRALKLLRLFSLPMKIYSYRHIVNGDAAFFKIQRRDDDRIRPRSRRAIERNQPAGNRERIIA